MRFGEWLLCLSFIPSLLLPFISQSRHHQWVRNVAALPVFIGILQILIEGWRIQILPLDVLACLLFMLHRFGQNSNRRRQIIGGLGIVWLAFNVILANWLLPVPILPAPTGPYAVGVIDRELLDSARERRLMVSIWYPATNPGPAAPLTHYPDQIAEGLGRMTGLPSFVFQHVRYIDVAASEGVPLLTNAGRLPVLVFSPGMVALRLQNSSTFQELASWGYVVVAIDHTDAAAVTVFPDGVTRFSNFEHFGIDPSQETTVATINQRLLPVWIADQRFVLDTLETWNTNDPFFADQLDLNHIGIFGHSFGGATALETCEVDPRCQVAVNLDGGLYGTRVNQPTTRPFLLFTSMESNQLEYAVKQWNYLLANAQNQAVWLELPNSSHLSFTFAQLLSPVLAPEGFEPRKGLAIADTYVRTFLDVHLRGANPQHFTALAKQQDVRWIDN